MKRSAEDAELDTAPADGAEGAAPAAASAGGAEVAAPAAAPAGGAEVAAPAAAPAGGAEVAAPAAVKKPPPIPFSFDEVDPLYALFGEVGVEKVFGPAAELREELLDKYLVKAVLKGAVKKPKDWIELWAKMDIPVDRQTEVLAPIMVFYLRERPNVLGKVLAHLLIGKRTKTKTIQDSVKLAYKGHKDEHGSLREMLYMLFPRNNACFPKGWSRIGWSWDQWWTLVEGTIGALDPPAAFNQLGLLLDSIERAAKEGPTLVHQEQPWNANRLKKVRAMLCKCGQLESESDLAACVDATLM